MKRDLDWWEKFWQEHPQGYGGPRKSLLNFAKKYFLTHPNSTAVDVGAGDGRYALSLARMGYKVDAIEYAQSGVNLIKKRAQALKVKINAFQGDFTKMVSNRRQYDLVFSSGLLEEIPSKHHVASIKKFINWTKPGGLNITKYCVWIKGRGNLVQKGIGRDIYKRAGWKIIYFQGPDNQEGVKKDIKFDRAIQSKVKTETIVARFVYN